MSILSVPLVATYREVAVKATQSDATHILEQVRAIRTSDSQDGSAHSSAVETAFRERLMDLIATLDIEQDDFSPVWYLLDALNILCDNELCEYALSFWLVEDLLDSQTINGCRKVFNYLESRRERMTKVNFKHKNLTILRCCNELLRRLSRAEDTVFCGRVFIYLFQSFPIGDKSSVNLRGEFHTENLTLYDAQDSSRHQATEEMEVDSDTNPPADSRPDGRLDDLYSVFWSMQNLFSSPTKLFEDASMQQFKDGIQKTMECFSQVTKESAPASVQDPEKRGVKRKREHVNGDTSDTNASSFNPKYLTNRDLFDLEVHDIEFRRHVLVQALILLEFLLSLSTQAKAKLSTMNLSKSIMSTLYDKYTLSETDRQWCVDTRKQIEKGLEEANGTEGRYYLRAVNMVLSRDKNWAFWKAEGCPPISKDAVPLSVTQESEDSLHKISKDANRPLMKPKGADQLAFLSQTEPMDVLKGRKLNVPSLEDYYKGIQTDDLDLDFADDEEKKEIEERKAGKLWRALRSARGRQFQLCEDIKNGENLDALIGKVKQEDDPGDHSQQQDKQELAQVKEDSVDAPAPPNEAVQQDV